MKDSFSCDPGYSKRRCTFLSFSRETKIRGSKSSTAKMLSVSISQTRLFRLDGERAEKAMFTCNSNIRYSLSQQEWAPSYFMGVTCTMENVRNDSPQRERVMFSREMRPFVSQDSVKNTLKIGIL